MISWILCERDPPPYLSCVIIPRRKGTGVCKKKQWACTHRPFSCGVQFENLLLDLLKRIY